VENCFSYREIYVRCSMNDFHDAKLRFGQWPQAHVLAAGVPLRIRANRAA
jgi:hypothetical protein